MDETLLAMEYRFQDNWKYWNDVERGAAVLRMLKTGLSRRALGKIAGCSEGLIRYVEKVARLPLYWKEQLLKGYSTRQVMAAWRAQQREQS